MDDSKEFFLFWSFGILKKVVMKKSFTFSFCERETHKNRTSFTHKPSKKKKKKKMLGLCAPIPGSCTEGQKHHQCSSQCACGGRRRVFFFFFFVVVFVFFLFGVSSFSKVRLGVSNSFTLIRIRMMMTRTFLSFSRLGSLSARERQNLTDRLLLSSHACDKTG